MYIYIFPTVTAKGSFQTATANDHVYIHPLRLLHHDHHK